MAKRESLASKDDPSPDGGDRQGVVREETLRGSPGALNGYHLRAHAVLRLHPLAHLRGSGLNVSLENVDVHLLGDGDACVAQQRALHNSS